jgi:hypothetical protein
MPKLSRNKGPQIYTNLESFPTWIQISEKEKTCTYSIWTRRPIYDFFRIHRISRASLIPINRPLTFEEKTQAWEEEFKATSRRILGFLSSFIYFMYVYNFSQY